MTASIESRTPSRPEVEPLIVAGLPRYRAIVALDIERSTSRPDPVKAELRNKSYELFDAALCSAGIRKRHRDRYIDRGDGLLALIHPVDQAAKALLLSRAIPALSRLLTDYNATQMSSRRGRGSPEPRDAEPRRSRPPCRRPVRPASRRRDIRRQEGRAAARRGVRSPSRHTPSFETSPRRRLVHIFTSRFELSVVPGLLQTED
jgi:hypothetical protein